MYSGANGKTRTNPWKQNTLRILDSKEFECIPESLHCSPETVRTLFVHGLYPNTKQKVKKNRVRSWMHVGYRVHPVYTHIVVPLCMKDGHYIMDFG